MNKYNQEWIDKHNPCTQAVKWAKPLIGKPVDEAIQICIEKEKYVWAEWALCKELTHRNNVRWAIFSAEQGLDIFEKEYPEDKRPRRAIEAAKKWVEEPTKENENAATDAAHAAYAAAYAAAANAATDAAHAANAAAYAAAYSTAYSTAATAAHTAHAANAAAYAAAYSAANAAGSKTRVQCDEYGLKLLREQWETEYKRKSHN